MDCVCVLKELLRILPFCIYLRKGAVDEETVQGLDESQHKLVIYEAVEAHFLCASCTEAQ